jgi:hypothetical protein
VWDIATAAAVAEDGHPDWKFNGADAVAGAGWVRCDFTAAGVILTAGAAYTAAVWQPAAVSWYSAQTGYWSSGAGASGLTDGPLSAPGDAASANGQGSYDTTGAWTYPGSNPGTAESHYVDPEVTPVTWNGHPAASLMTRRR